MSNFIHTRNCQSAFSSFTEEGSWKLPKHLNWKFHWLVWRNLTYTKVDTYRSISTGSVFRESVIIKWTSEQINCIQQYSSFTIHSHDRTFHCVINHMIWVYILEMQSLMWFLMTYSTWAIVNSFTLCVSSRYFGGLLVGCLQGTSKEELLSPFYSPLPDYWKQNPLVSSATQSDTYTLKNADSGTLVCMCVCVHVHACVCVCHGSHALHLFAAVSSGEWSCWWLIQREVSSWDLCKGLCCEDTGGSFMGVLPHW